jgi:hypothetical protein
MIRSREMPRVVDPRLLPSEADVRRYEEHGWFVTGAVLPDDLLDDAAYGAQRYHAGERDVRLHVTGGFLDWRPEHGDCLRLNDYASLQNEELRALVGYPVIGAIAARLARARSIRLFHDQLITKPGGASPDETTVGWHTDRSYWATCSSTSMLTAWIPLQDCTLEMGPLAVVDRSHRWESDCMATFTTKDLAGLERDRFARRDHEVVPLVLRRGQLSFHHAYTVHGSYPNRSGLDRIALTVHLQDGHNRYVRVLDCRERPALHMNDLLCRKDAAGVPDYSDPAICPLLWSSDEEP